MEVLLFIVGVVIGIFVSWYFYKKSDKDNRIEFQKIHDEFQKRAVDRLKEEFGDKAKVNKILSELWQEISDKHGPDFIKYRCPKCGSDNIQSAFISNNDDTLDIDVCGECGYEL